MTITPATLPPKVLSERKRRIGRILPILKKTYPQAKCSLRHNNALQLLVATILSAQCTDDRVNIVTKELFRKYKTAADYAAAAPEELEKDIQSTGFYRNKARSIRAMAQSLIDQHGGKVPKTMDELTALAGVGRKTANVVLGNAFNINDGVVVDTHVTRLSNRLGLTDHASDAVKIERDLMAVVPREDWTLWSHLLIHHGRAICQARKPKCDQCPLLDDCPAGQAFVQEPNQTSSSSARSATKTRRK
ncbi:MAG TPA: endonuclease III [Tepidisphaeraceae bacterium]|nr:endonuclease III [Tepidisphaeraceae bacterium]